MRTTYTYISGLGPHTVTGALGAAGSGALAGTVLGGAGGTAGHAVGDKLMGLITHNPSADVMAMGRSMKYRVEPYAIDNGYGYYEALPKPLFNRLEKLLGHDRNESLNVWVNEKWINYQMLQGKGLVDIGAPDPALRPPGVPPLDHSPYYSMELEQVSGYGGYSQDIQPSWNLS